MVREMITKGKIVKTMKNQVHIAFLMGFILGTFFIHCITFNTIGMWIMFVAMFFLFFYVGIQRKMKKIP